MSPIYTGWKEAPKDIKQIVKEGLKSQKYKQASLINEGFAFRVDEKDRSHILEWVVGSNNITEGQYRNAHGNGGVWHVIGGLKGKSNHERIFGGRMKEEANSFHATSRYTPDDTVQLKVPVRK
jgi:hypothetical protein